MKANERFALLYFIFGCFILSDYHTLFWGWIGVSFTCTSFWLFVWGNKSLGKRDKNGYKTP